MLDINEVFELWLFKLSLVSKCVSIKKMTNQICRHIQYHHHHYHHHHHQQHHTICNMMIIITISNCFSLSWRSSQLVLSASAGKDFPAVKHHLPLQIIIIINITTYIGKSSSSSFYFFNSESNHWQLKIFSFLKKKFNGQTFQHLRCSSSFFLIIDQLYFKCCWLYLNFEYTRLLHFQIVQQVLDGSWKITWGCLRSISTMSWSLLGKMRRPRSIKYFCQYQ